MSSLSGIEVSASAADLRQLLAEWIRLYDTAAATFPQTRERWFIEPTLVSLLSTAAWNLGFPSIVEAKAARSSSVNGHADLVVHLPQEAVAAEAKIGWFSYADGLSEIFGRLEDAEEQAATLPSDLAPRFAALLFGVIERGGEPVRDLLNCALEYGRAKKTDILAWTLMPDCAPEVRYPGVVLAGTLARRPNIS